MYVCICNRVTTSELAQDYAAARARCGTQCGKCIKWLADGSERACAWQTQEHLRFISLGK